MLRVLTKCYLIDWQIRGLKDVISGNILALYSNRRGYILLVSVGRCTHVTLLPVGLQESLLMIIK